MTKGVNDLFDELFGDMEEMIELPFVNYILGLLIITNSGFIYSSINLMRKNEKLRDWLVDLENDLQQVENEITGAHRVDLLMMKLERFGER